MNNVEQLILRVREKGKTLEFSGPSTSESVSALEEALEVQLPPSFIEFLQTYGSGGEPGSWISGIYKDRVLEPNPGSVYGDTIRYREMFNLPDHLVVIFAQDDEIIWCLDTSTVNEVGENPVVSFDVFDRGKLHQINTSFLEFFVEYLSFRIE